MVACQDVNPPKLSQFCTDVLGPIFVDEQTKDSFAFVAVNKKEIKIAFPD